MIYLVLRKIFTLISIITNILYISSCSNKENSHYCHINKADSHLEIEILSNYDVINCVITRKTFELPYSYALNDEIVNMIKKQLDDSYIFEGNQLIQENTLYPEEQYSMSETINALRNEGYDCQ